MKRILRHARNRYLSTVNRGRIKAGLRQIESGCVPLVFIFTPQISHLAPYCLANIDPRYTPVLVMNAVPPGDVEWIHSLHANYPLVELKTSLRGNADTILPHGDVLNDLMSVSPGNFATQDPDCFITDMRFWDEVSLEPDDFACGPFWMHATVNKHVLPHTFFLLFDVTAFHNICGKYGIDANIIRELPPTAARAAHHFGYEPGVFPHEAKDYFDTLQAYWVLSFNEGMKFRQIPGERESVFHIGGTSYLYSSDIDLTHGEYWPLGVRYFNLRLLEFPQGKRFRERFNVLIQTHESSERLLSTYPEFRDGWRREELDQILDHITG